MQCFRHVQKMSRCLWRVRLLAIKCAQKGSVRIRDHPSSPSNSDSLMAATSFREKTLSPHTSSKRAITSGFGGEPGSVPPGTKDVSKAKARPLLKICTVSPCSIHDETRRKLFRRSATVAVFMICFSYHKSRRLSNPGNGGFCGFAASSAETSVGCFIFERRQACGKIPWPTTDRAPGVPPAMRS